jgi:hypothetical protein
MDTAFSGTTRTVGVMLPKQSAPLQRRRRRKPMNPADIVERLRKITVFDDQGRIAGFSALLVISEAADEIERLRRTRAEIIEECAKVAEAWDGKPCGPASGWTDDQRDYYDAGQLDASSSIVRAVRALATQGKK